MGVISRLVLKSWTGTPKFLLAKKTWQLRKLKYLIRPKVFCITKLFKKGNRNLLRVLEIIRVLIF